ncbi:MAG: hypothetical protein WBP41_18470, partial [Saprospiraceae bacterium]
MKYSVQVVKIKPGIKSLVCLLGILLLFSCSKQHKEIEPESNLFSVPKTYPLNTHGGYIINPVSGDSI